MALVLHRIAQGSLLPNVDSGVPQFQADANGPAVFTSGGSAPQPTAARSGKRLPSPSVESAFRHKDPPYLRRDPRLAFSLMGTLRSSLASVN